VIFEEKPVAAAELGLWFNDYKKCADAPPKPALQGACPHLPPPSPLATPLTITLQQNVRKTGLCW